MNRYVHSLSCLLLALALVLTGPGAGGAATGATMVVLCGGDMPQTVWLDAKGNPVDPAEICDNCPYCLVFKAPPTDVFAPLPAFDVVPVQVRLGPDVPAVPRPAGYLHPDPRGPPAQLPVSLCPRESRPNSRFPAEMADVDLDAYQALIAGSGRRFAGKSLKAV